VKTAVVAVTEASENDVSFVRSTITIRIFERDEVGWIRGVNFTIVPREAHRGREFVGENARTFIAAITVAVFEYADAAVVNQLLKFVVQVAARDSVT